MAYGLSGQPQSRSPDLMQDLASFLLMRGKYAWCAAPLPSGALAPALHAPRFTPARPTAATASHPRPHPQRAAAAG